MIRPCWITTDGEVIHCPNPMDHTHAAFHRFPHMHDSEEYVANLGWIKVTGYHDPPRVWAERQPTQRQIDAMFSMSPDDYEVFMAAVQEFLEGDRSVWNAPSFPIPLMKITE